jgi:SAM-dependent methyltransferase
VVENPDTRAKLVSVDNKYCYFEDGSTMLLFDGTPILISDRSIFNTNSIVSFKISTQNDEYSNTKSIKNYIRRNIIPDLSKDFGLKKRFEFLSGRLSAGSKVLVLGTGDKGSLYKSVFANSIVITSDVHLLFKPDVVIDAHFIPFENDFFDLVLASQVLEHTINPWLVSQEIQRVVKENGLIQIDAPQNFPYHAAPYDFFRFILTGIRSLFEKCSVLKIDITEGNLAALAITLSDCFVNLSKNRIIRILLLIITRILFGWLKYFDNYKLNNRTVSNPKGFAFTFKKDNITRDSQQLLEEFYSLIV